MEDKKLCIVIRGIPGSGKSTLAQSLVGDTGKIHNTDSYFMVEGKYQFDPKKIGQFHARNFYSFQKSLKDKISPVIVDNTNTQKWEFKKYEEAAIAAGYEVEVICVPHIDAELAAKRNTHGVPIDAIRKMLARWED